MVKIQWKIIALALGSNLVDATSAFSVARIGGDERSCCAAIVLQDGVMELSEDGTYLLPAECRDYGLTCTRLGFTTPVVAGDGDSEEFEEPELSFSLVHQEPSKFDQAKAEAVADRTAAKLRDANEKLSSLRDKVQEQHRAIENDQSKYEASAKEEVKARQRASVEADKVASAKIALEEELAQSRRTVSRQRRHASEDARLFEATTDTLLNEVAELAETVTLQSGSVTETRKSCEVAEEKWKRRLEAAEQGRAAAEAMFSRLEQSMLEERHAAKLEHGLLFAKLRDAVQTRDEAEALAASSMEEIDQLKTKAREQDEKNLADRAIMVEELEMARERLKNSRAEAASNSWALVDQDRRALEEAEQFGATFSTLTETVEDLQKTVASLREENKAMELLAVTARMKEANLLAANQSEAVGENNAKPNAAWEGGTDEYSTVIDVTTHEEGGHIVEEAAMPVETRDDPGVGQGEEGYARDDTPAFVG